MIRSIILPNTMIMQNLLEVLGFVSYFENTNHITLYTSDMELTYTIVSSSEEVQNIFGKTTEWRELVKHLK